MRDDRLYLSNIFECIERIESYTHDGKEAFLQTTIIQDAVIRNPSPAIDLPGLSYYSGFGSYSYERKTTHTSTNWQTDL